MGIQRNRTGTSGAAKFITRRRRKCVLTASAHALEGRQLLSGAQWANLSASGSAPSNGGGMMMLLSNGTVLVQNGSNPPPSSSVSILSPQANTGSYVNGAWASTGGLNESRLFFSTATLPDGRIFAIGGEYPKFSNTVELYNPATGVWTYQDPIPTPATNVDLNGTVTGASNANPIVINTANTQQLQNGMQVVISGVNGDTAANGTWTVSGVTSTSFTINANGSSSGSFVNDGKGSWNVYVPQYGDDPIQVLPPDAAHPDGQVLAGYFNTTTTYRFNPNAAPGSQWTTTAGGKLHADQSDEEAWVKLKDGSILSYDVFASQGGTFQAQRYVPASDTWVDASTLSSTNPPSVMSNPTTPTSNPSIFNGQGSEMGPGFLLPDGRVIYFGANGNTAYYNPATDTWTAGPKEPSPGGTQMVGTDDPGAELPNGHVLIALSPLGNIPKGSGYSFPTPSNIYEFDPTAPAASAFTDVSPGGSLGGSTIGDNAFKLNMVVLPTGQVLLSDENAGFQVYTEDPATGPQNAWRPVVSNFVENADGSFTLTGTQINGISEGANYGDDNESASNYPLVQLTDSGGNVSYATTSGWSSTGVVTGSTPETTNFTLPSGKILSDFATLRVIANGIPSLPIPASSTPNVTAPADQSAAEGTSSFNLGSFIDPDGSPWTVDVNWGDGSAETIFSLSKSGSLGTQAHDYEEGTYVPKVTVTDSTGLSGSAKFNVSVSDPAVVPTGGFIVNDVEGAASGSQTVATFTDPGGPEVTGDYAATIDWGDGTAITAGSISVSGGLFSVNGNHGYAEEGSYPVLVTISHEGAPIVNTGSAAVVSDPPVIPTGGFTVNAVEGAATGSLVVATFVDPGGAEPNPSDPGPISDHYAATIDWGDSTPTTSGAITFAGGVFSISGGHTYGEEGSYTISVTIDHELAPAAVTSSPAIVSDPAVTATGTSFTAIACVPLTGVSVATFTDPGGAEPNPSDPSGTINNHYQVASINWGDGTALDTSSGTLSFGGSPGSKTDSYTISGSHTYATEGVYSVTSIIDHEGAAPTTVTSTATVKDNLGLLVLDPSNSGALTVTGNGGVVVNNCGAAVVDSTSPSAAFLAGNANVSAMDVDVTGGVVTAGHATISGPVGHETPTADPIGLPLPVAPTTVFPAVNYSGSATLTLPPGTYVGGIQDNGQGNIVLLPGVYEMAGGGLQVTGKGSLSGAGVLIINAPSGSNGSICFTGQGNVNLTAPLPASLPSAYSAYKGITIFQDPSSLLPVILSGQGSVTMDGALYAPGAALVMSGNGGLTDSTDTTAPIAEVIVYDAYVTGNGVLTINADAAASNPPSNTPLPGAAQASFTSFTSSTNPAVPGQPLSFTVTMASTPASAGPPAGSIAFFDQTTHLDLGSVTLSGGVATLNTSALQTLGGHLITATYFAGSPNFAPPATPASLTQQLQSALVESGVLYVGGNPNSDDIQVQLNKGQVSVNLHDGSGSFQTAVAALNALVVYGQGNGENIQIDNHLMLPAFLFAGNGHDVQIQGGGGPTVEVGGSGSGKLSGGAGRDILIAGTGGAELQGGAGGSILVGGFTDYDSNLPALQAALSEWSSADSYAIRTSSAALSIFSASTVHSGGLTDQLQGVGGSSPLDWFFASALDQITGDNGSELKVVIT